jgi:hypothetical protein
MLIKKFLTNIFGNQRQEFSAVNQESNGEEMGNIADNITETVVPPPLPPPSSSSTIASAANFSSKSEHVKHILVKWSADAPFQCYPKIFETKNVTLKIIWLLLFILFTCLTGVILCKNILEYREHQLVSQIEILNEIEPEFPCVTICDTNMFPTEYAERLLKKIAKETYDLDLDDFVYTVESFEKLKRIISLAKLNVTNPNYPSEDLKRLGLKLEQITRFSYDNQMYGGGGSDASNSSSKDLTDNFRWVFEFEYGSCYQFNSGYKEDNSPAETKRVQVQGPAYGLKVFVSDLEYKNRFPTAESNGFKVFIHNKTLMPR